MALPQMVAPKTVFPKTVAVTKRSFAKRPFSRLRDWISQFLRLSVSERLKNWEIGIKELLSLSVSKTEILRDWRTEEVREWGWETVRLSHWVSQSLIERLRDSVSQSHFLSFLDWDTEWLRNWEWETERFKDWETERLCFSVSQGSNEFKMRVQMSRTTFSIV